MTKSIEYLAGLFDGEGSFSIQVGLRHRRGTASGFVNPSMAVNLYYGWEVLDHFAEAFGGAIYAYQRGGEALGKRWHLGAKEQVLAAALSLEPHLEIKRDIARRFIHALSLFPENGKGASRRSGARVWTTERIISVAEIALTLNPPRSRTSNRTLDYLNDLRRELPSTG